MALMTRRRALTTGGLAAGTSLTLAGMPRKPRAADAALGKLQLRDPPTALPAGLGWVDAAGHRHLPGEYAGVGLVLNFWATWCGPCVAEMPSLAALAMAVKDAGVAVLPVSGDSGGAATVRSFYAAHGITDLGIWLDPDQSASTAVNVDGFPTTLIVDRKGREVARIAGGTDWSGAGTAATVAALCGV